MLLLVRWWLTLCWVMLRYNRNILFPDLSVDCLLGADFFLQNHGAVLDSNNHTSSFGTGPRSIIPISFNQRPTLSPFPNAIHCTLQAPADVEVPGRTIQWQVDGMHSDGFVILIEPLSSLPDYLHVACSLGLVKNSQVANVSPPPITLFKGMRLAMNTSEHSILVEALFDNLSVVCWKH